MNEPSLEQQIERLAQDNLVHKQLKQRQHKSEWTAKLRAEHERRFIEAMEWVESLN